MHIHSFIDLVFLIRFFFSETANMKYRASVSNTNDLASNAQVSGRRTVLPAHSTDNSHIGILNILYNNIGKDLSRVSMPVAINEPLSLLQRVSEELEYSELLDIANHTDDPFERMVRAWSIVHKFYPNCVYQQKADFCIISVFRFIKSSLAHAPVCIYSLYSLPRLLAEITTHTMELSVYIV